MTRVAKNVFTIKFDGPSNQQHIDYYKKNKSLCKKLQILLKHMEQLYGSNTFALMSYQTILDEEYENVFLY